MENIFLKLLLLLHKPANRCHCCPLGQGTKPEPEANAQIGRWTRIPNGGLESDIILKSQSLETKAKLHFTYIF